MRSIDYPKGWDRMINLVNISMAERIYRPIVSAVPSNHRMIQLIKRVYGGLDNE